MEDDRFTMILNDSRIFPATELLNKNEKRYSDTPISGKPGAAQKTGSDVPEKIQEMLSLYEYGDGSFHQKCLNFYNQGKCMEDYEDDAPWYGDILRYFPAYHDLNVKQLRGYFTWRKNIRQGQYKKTCSSFVYIYLYELLNGIGTKSPQDSMDKMKLFMENYVERGLGDPSIKNNLKRWMPEFAVLFDFPAEDILAMEQSGRSARDQILTVLKDPDEFSDEDVFNAMLRYASPKAVNSPVMTKDLGKASRLFSSIWRHASSSYEENGKDLFSKCFGALRTHLWHPLGNAVYLEQRELTDREYVINALKKYSFHDGSWEETKIDPITKDRNAFFEFMHVVDMRSRRILKTGRYLRHRDGEDWAEACVDAALNEIRKEAEEAARPKVSLDLSGLDKIREDAGVTRDSLLTEEEIDLEASAATTEGPVSAAEVQDAAPKSSDGYDGTSSDVLDDFQAAVLRLLLEGRSAASLITENLQMPEIVADSINESLFDDIGDNAIDCNDGELSLVEDYIEDISRIIGENR